MKGGQGLIFKTLEYFTSPNANIKPYSTKSSIYQFLLEEHVLDVFMGTGCGHVTWKHISCSHNDGNIGVDGNIKFDFLRATTLEALTQSIMFSPLSHERTYTALSHDSKLCI